jgi:uncharacterized membrane protein YkvA (DUF1232 family)
MRHEPPLPAGTPLPLPRLARHDGPAFAGPVPLAPRAIAEFNDLLHELHPDAPHVDADAVASVARWLMELPPDQGEALLQARLGRLAELQALVADPDWAVEPALARRIGRMLAYVERVRDLIPDDTPRVGRLDDALLVELAWPMVAEELEDYRDFQRFRDESGDAFGGHPTRDNWLQSRLEEGALWEQLHRVRHQHYVDYGPLEGGLRVV